MDAMERALVELSKKAEKPDTRSAIADKIINNNPPVKPLHGLHGILAMALSRSDCKRIAADKIQYIRANRVANKSMGRNWRGADARLLARVAHIRRLATPVRSVEQPTMALAAE